MKIRKHLIHIMLSVTFLTGCASLGEEFPGGIREAPEERFLRETLRKGRELEKKGDMVAALRQYKLAATVDPSSQEALESRGRLKSKISKEAGEHYKAGLKFHKQGKYDRARQEFLIALRLKSEYPEVIDMLTSRKRLRIKRYVVHTIKPGESLSKVAMTYYGDYQKFPIIAKYNNITDATRVHAGQEIKIPEIEGLAFISGKETVETEETEVAYAGFWDREAYSWDSSQQKAPELRGSEEEQEPVDQIAIYREHGIELYSQKQYQDALEVFELVLKAEPRDKLATEYAYKSHFENAMTLFDNEDYLGAKSEFEASLKYKSDCQECISYARDSEELYKEAHYKKGIEYFGKEQLYEAIQEWERVRALDPSYKKVENLIDKAETILKNIEKIKEDLRKELQE